MDISNLSTRTGSAFPFTRTISIDNWSRLQTVLASWWVHSLLSFDRSGMVSTWCVRLIGGGLSRAHGCLSYLAQVRIGLIRAFKTCSQEGRLLCGRDLF